MDIMSSLSLGFGVLGVTIAFYQGFERKKLKHYLRSQSWHIYSMADISSASIHAALTTYKETNKNNIDTIVFEHLSKSYAYNLSLFLETIRQIQLSESDFSVESIMKWQFQGKIHKEHSGFFFRMATMGSPNLFSLSWQSLTVKFKNKLIQRIQRIQSQQNPQQNSKQEQEVS